jgi:uncharacterized protein (TIGR02391 family)
MSIEAAGSKVLTDLIRHFRESGLTTEDLRRGYVGPPLPELLDVDGVTSKVDFDVAFKELETKKLVKTGPMEALKNRPGSGVHIFGFFSKREYAYLTEAGYAAASKLQSSPPVRRAPKRPALMPAIDHFYGIHPSIRDKCGSLYEAGEFAEAVEKSFKVVRDRLRSLTGFETGSDAFGKGGLSISGAAAPHVEKDFNQAVKFLTMSIDMFRNEKSHSSDARIDDPIRAHQYLSLSSLAMFLLENAEADQK